MSFRELRDFTEIMRALGYPRMISVENFRTPNFGLVADVLYWMVQRYDPLVSISDNIETETDRVNFLKSIAQVMAGKARITLKTKNLYSADGKAVKELLKIARTLYRAHRSQHESKSDEGDGTPFALTSKLADLKSTRSIASEITEIGVKLYDLLGQEEELREARKKALLFLDAISSNLDSRAEHTHMEQSIRDAIASVQENVKALERQCEEMKADKKSLQAKIKKKKAELERGEKRLRSIEVLRPHFMDEYEALEQELSAEYEVYIERFRNLDYLEHELDKHNQAEKEKLEASDRALKRLQKRLRDDELRLFIGEQDVGEDGEEAKRPGGAMDKRPMAAGGSRGMGGGAVVGSMGAGSEGSDTGSETASDSDSEDRVSLGSDSGSTGSDDSDLIDDDESGSDSGLGSDSSSASDDEF
mmetsp:Transcript_106139/g.257831  ORF Transcript_106139/g.257831 Transcript_106139/m.257831 type:complete len:418 (-) Transcript_106139:106-1359(-)